MARRTATTGNALLGLIALRHEWSTWDLAKQLRRNMRFFWPRAESRVYAEALALAEGGFTRRRRLMIGKRPRTMYSINARGRRRLQRWLATPPKGTSLECEPLLRVFLGGLGTTENLLAALQQVKVDAEAILEVGRVVAKEYLEQRAPFQDQVEVRAFVFDFLSNHAFMLLRWAERTERTVSARQGQTPSERQAGALQRIGATLKLYPAVGEAKGS